MLSLVEAQFSENQTKDIKNDNAFSLLNQDLSQIFSQIPPLVPVVKILKKNRDHWKNLGESGGQTFKESN